MDEIGTDTQERPFTLGALARAVGVCIAVWALALTAFFVYANTRSATAAASGCVGVDCPSERTALLTLGFFGVLPTAFVGVLVSLVALVYGARSVRRPFVLGAASALAGLALAVLGLITIATFESN
ncbi:MAG TPA: hypothetical protein VFT95_19805 [Micromonosporaceae bacterium]|nr:hypothetical protein [Micromonosporaceae bacterium]